MPQSNQLAESIHRDLRNLGKANTTASVIQSLMVYEQTCKRPSRTGTVRRSSLELFFKRSIREFREEHPHEAEILTRRFLEKESAKQIAHKLSVSEQLVNRDQHEALGSYANWVEIEEQLAREEHQIALVNLLPPPSYSRLYGSADIRRKLIQILKSQREPWVISLSGLGGIGKTALLDHAVRNLISDFPYKQLIWIRAEQSGTQGLDENALVARIGQRMLPATLPYAERRAALKVKLKESPALIILDNLNAEFHQASWFDFLQDLANPSKVVLTNRAIPVPLARVYVMQVKELGLADAKGMLQDQIKRRGLLSSLSEVSANPAAIFRATGGHPLALKLVVGLLNFLPLKEVLEALRSLHQRNVEEMYVQLYQRAWENLSREARRLLLAMPIVSEVGATADQLAGATKLTPANLRNGISELRKASLLEIRSDLGEPRYGIHQLTHTFLANTQSNGASKPTRTHSSRVPGNYSKLS